LKAIAAGEGDVVCTAGNQLVINGRRVAPVLSVDSHGARLPRWGGCRRLASGEAFAFSGRVPTSFDSRYYGPIATATAQVYRPIFTWER
jgi:type IV secretory pathway protease TraF